MKEVIAFILAVLISNTVRADNRMFNVHLIVVQGEQSLPTDVQVQLFKEGLTRLSEVKVKPRIVSIKEIADPIGKNTLSDYYSRLFNFKELGLHRRNKGHTYFLLPPIVEKGVTYGGGQAGAICTTTRNKSRQFGEVSLRLNSTSGQSRVEHSKVVVLHEVLHNLGANHIDTKTVVLSKNPLKRAFIPVPNVMHSAAQGWIGQYSYANLPIVSRTRREVKQCNK